MRRDDETLLSNAIQALQGAEPDASQMSASAKRVAERLGMDGAAGMVGHSGVSAIESCDDIQQLLAADRAGTLSQTRSLLIEAHLRDCGACLRQSRSGAALDWSVPDRFGAKKSRAENQRPRRLGWTLGWAFAPTLALLAGTFFVYKAYWEIPPGVRAEVQSIDGLSTPALPSL